MELSLRRLEIISPLRTKEVSFNLQPSDINLNPNIPNANE
jgi:hypothetical protein